MATKEGVKHSQHQTNVNLHASIPSFFTLSIVQSLKEPKRVIAIVINTSFKESDGDGDGDDGNRNEGRRRDVERFTVVVHTQQKEQRKRKRKRENERKVTLCVKSS